MVTSSFDAAIWQFRTLQLLLRFKFMISLRRTVHTYGRCCRSSPSALTNNLSRVTHHLLFICVAHCRGCIVLYMMCKLLCAAFRPAKTGCLHAAAFKPAKTGCLHALLEAEYMCKICHFNLDIVACSRTPQWRYRDRYLCEVCSSIERLRSLMYNIRECEDIVHDICLPHNMRVSHQYTPEASTEYSTVTCSAS